MPNSNDLPVTPESGLLFPQSGLSNLLDMFESLVNQIVTHKMPGCRAIGFAPLFATKEEADRWDEWAASIIKESTDA